MFEIIFYETKKGERPAEDFIFSLQPKMQAKIIGMMHVLEKNGNLVREPYSKYIDDGIFELRCKVGSDISRVMYFFYVGKKIVMTNGFVKKTQKTPKSEINLAKKYRDDYIERMGNHENA